MGDYVFDYIQQVKTLLDRIVTEDKEELKQAATILADAIEGDGRIFASGKHPFLYNDARHLCSSWRLDGNKRHFHTRFRSIAN